MMQIGDGDSTPELTEFRAAYDANYNVWWGISCGHHMNLFDAACEEIDRLQDELSRKQGHGTSG